MLVESEQMVPITRLQKEVFERHEIKNMIETRMKWYNPEDTVSWEDVKANVNLIHI